MSSSPLNSRDLRRIFQSLDQDGDGLVSIEELNWLLERTGHGPYNHASILLDELVLIMRKPAAAAAALDFDEFCHFYESLMLKHNEAVAEDHEESDLYEAFKVFDLNDDGFLSPEEIQCVLVRFGLWNHNHDNGNCERIIRQYDINSDGLVDFEEFKRMMLAT